MTHNRVKEKVLNGGTSVGAVVPFASPELVEYLGWVGFEWVFIDGENGSIDWQSCQELVRACDAVGISSMVRVPKLDDALIANYLQTGTHGIAVPHVNTVQEAEAAVSYARYYPEGRRGSDAGASRSSAYGLQGSPADYFRRANDEIIVAVWIEEPQGMGNLSDILQVPGIDVVHFGENDLALAMGHPGQKDHPAVQALLAEGQAKLKASGKILLGMPKDLESARRMLDAGERLIGVQVLDMWSRSARELIGSLKDR
jgi:4-hydroxy-2-oxoheptanedioate aldolase